MKKLFWVALLLSLLISSTFSQTSKEILIYDGEKEESNLSSLGFWAAPEGCKVEEVEGIAFSGKKSIKIYFVWTSWWAGMGINFTKWDLNNTSKIFDLSQFNSLEFYIKAEKSDNYNLLITLVEAPTKANEEEKYSEKFTITGGVSTSWTKISVPLKSFTVDLKRIWGMSIEVSGAPAGDTILYVDDIKFVK
ncbi:MAG TPA: hypothetical protein PKW23_00170 [Dictyoglomaceae bacterium]|nr:hypothetical protein [Dictyoglomaceae bacterium]HOL39478.1 hypothetical protein [Dictyoglomaceae bacterium]HPP15381.1 hypothetical protein [Dictyoglomaceae bacterium]HPU43664.1 hypothetical protein [Dictyoglomaceae bacterium]